MSGSEVRRVILAQQTPKIRQLYRNADRGSFAGALAVFLLDVFDPVGYAVAWTFGRRYGRPDPNALLGAALASTPPRWALAIGITSARNVAEIVEQAAVTIATVASLSLTCEQRAQLAAAANELVQVAGRLREPAPWREEVRVVVVADLGVSLVPLDPGAPDPTPLDA